MKRRGSQLTVFLCCSLILCGSLGMGAAVGFGEEQETSRITREEHISFALYGDAQNQQIAQEAAEIFQKQNGCRVDLYCYSTEEELGTNIIGQIAAGESFDVFAVNQELLSWLAEKGEVLPLEEIVESRRQEGESFYETALSCGQIRGRQYGIPTGVTPYMIYYNRTLLEEAGLEDPQAILERAGWNLEGFGEYLRKIREKTGAPGLTLLADWNVKETFLRYNQGGWMEEAGRLKLDETSRSTMETLKKLVREEALGWGEGEVYDMVQREFAEGRLPMIIGGMDMTRVCSQVEFSWDILPMPSAHNDFSNCSVEASLLAVGDGKHAELAKKFADFYVSALGQKLRLQQGECVMPSLSMVFYTSMGDVVFPEHSNYYFFAIENGQTEGRSEITEERRSQLDAIWRDYME